MAVLCGVVGISIGEAAVDPRLIRPTDIDLGTWLTLSRDDRKMFMAGFSIGWEGPISAPPPAASPEQAPDPDAEAETDTEADPDAADAAPDVESRFEALDAEIVRLANVGANRHLRVATVLSRARLLDRLPLASYSGRDFLELPGRRRLMLLTGVQGGVYSRAVWEQLGKPRDSTTLDSGLSGARSLVTPPLAADPSRTHTWLINRFENEDQRSVWLINAISVYAKRFNAR
ncbi:MAG: hypothetical protein QF926_08100 [Alphaproteobacteria bacterium]|nr:hypothetical protein [Alphaproteobacteria bacterium]MDP6516568.1 hypothetical protein [Alphaproteobacteria bacterium]